MPEIPITPMLDMSFQLLLFLIPFFKPMPLEGQMALTLPVANEDRGGLFEPKNAAHVHPELTSDFSVLVETVKEGPQVGLMSRLVIRKADRDVQIPLDN